VLLVAACARDPETRKRQFLESGNEYFDAGDYRSAVIEYRNAVNIDPLFADARVRLAESYVRLGDGGNAVDQYVRAADLLPEDFDVQMHAGALLLAGGRSQEALDRANAALTLRESDVSAHILRGNALAELSSFEEALAALEEAIRLDPERGTTFTQKGFVQLTGGQLKEAEAAFTRAVELAPDSVDARLALGNYYWAAQRPADTESAFSAALEIEPDHAGANRAMAALALATGRTGEAERYLRRNADALGDSESVLALADYYLLAGRHQDAIDRLSPLASGDNPVAGAQERLARAHAASGDAGSARALVRDILARDSRNLDAQMLDGQLLLAEGQRDEALDVLEAAVGDHPTSAEAQFALGRLYASRGDVVAAEAAFREVLSLNPRVTAAHVELSKLQLTSGNVTASLRSAEQATRSDPDNVFARLILVRSLLASGELRRAEGELASLRSQHSNMAEVHAQAGHLAALRRDDGAARAAFARALEVDGDSFEAVSGLVALDLRAGDVAAVRRRVTERVAGPAPRPDMLLLGARAHASMGELEVAEGLLMRAIEVDSTLLPAYSMLGQVYLKQNRLDEARREFENMASRETKPVAALTMSGMILQAQGDVSQARDRFERALAVDPRAAVAANNLAWIQAEAGENLDIALQLAQTAVAASPDTPEITDTLGWIYYRKSLPQQAIAQFLRSVERSPETPLYHYHLGLAYILAGEADRGRAALQKGLAVGADPSLAADIQRALADL
jgi:tetratricopeptide (TPR) repeat protein